MNPETLRNVSYVIQGTRDYIESSSVGNEINTLQIKMTHKLNTYAINHRITGHLAGFGVALADFVLDIAKYPLVTIEHLAKSILEPFGVIIKVCTKEKFCRNCTLLSSTKHLGYGVKGAIYTFFSPFIALKLLTNGIRTISNPEKALSGWNLTMFFDMKTKQKIDNMFPDQPGS